MSGRNSGTDVVAGKTPLAHHNAAYNEVLNDLRARITGEANHELRALMDTALLAVEAVIAYPKENSDGGVRGANGVPARGSAAEIADEIAREKLDPGA